MRKAVASAIVGLVVLAGSAAHAVPGNDDFADATTITSFPFRESLDLSDATKEPDEPNSRCITSENDRHTVWYRYVPDADTAVSISVLSDFSATASLYTGTRLNELSGGDCAYGGGPIVALLRATETYYLQLAGFPEYGPPDGRVTLSIHIVPVVDLAVSRLEVTNLPFDTDFGSVPSGIRRRITVELANRANEDAGYGEYVVRACPRTEGFCDYIVFLDYISLEPGEHVTRTFDWTATVGAGDYTFSAQIHTQYAVDPDQENNYRSVHHYVIVGGTGFGVGVPLCDVLPYVYC
jgi:hypothetical protein